MLTDIRPKLVVPSRRVMSSRILDLGAKNAREQMQNLVALSDGELLVPIMLDVQDWLGLSSKHTYLFVVCFAGVCLCTDSWTSKQPAGNQYLSTRSAARDAETSNAELAAVTRQNDSEYVDGADDLMVTGEQVTEVMAEYKMQLSEDAKDDADCQPNRNKTPLADLFVGMPEFDVNLLFDEVSA